MILQDKVELYHASYVIVENIDLSLCADGKDFGKGFYVTTDYNQAYKFVKTAIKKALSLAKKGDIVLILGKGHEKTILRADGPHDFEDIKVVRDLLKAA